MKKIVPIIGLVLIFSAIGACEIEVITFGQAIKQCLIGLPIFAIGVM